MARSRNIKPSIMDNELLAELPPVSRLLFVYLWMLADREGRLEDRPKRIAVQALPYDRDVDVNTMLDGLAKQGFIVRYEAAGGKYIQITNFKKHQTPHVRESASGIPPMPQNSDGNAPKHDLGGDKEVPKHDLGSAEASPRSPDSLIPDSLIPDSLIPDSSANAHARDPDEAGDLPQPTAAARACKAMRAAGMQDVNPSHPKLTALLAAGITQEELQTAAADAAGRGKGFAYALAAAEGRRRDAATEPLPAARQQRKAAPATRYAEANRSIFGAPKGGEVIDV